MNTPTTPQAAQVLSDDEIVSHLASAGVLFQRFMGGTAGTKDCWSTSGSQDVRKIANGVRDILAKLQADPMLVLKGLHFENETIEGQTIEYDGGPIYLHHSRLSNIQWSLTGPAANTVVLLKMLSDDQSNRGMFEKTFPGMYQAAPQAAQGVGEVHAYGSGDGYWIRAEDKPLRSDGDRFKIAFYTHPIPSPAVAVPVTDEWITNVYETAMRQSLRPQDRCGVFKVVRAALATQQEGQAK